MTVNAVSSNSGAVQATAIQAKAESGEAQRAGRDATNDGDSDDGSVSAAKAPTSTVNMSGQTIGKLINIMA